MLWAAQGQDHKERFERPAQTWNLTARQVVQTRKKKHKNRNL